MEVMLRHTGERRSFKHNLQLAILLCLTAGFINAAGYLAFNVLTTNVTGHAALLAVGVATAHWRAARMVALWLILFLLGAFSSAVIISKVGRNKANAYTIPILIVIVMILFVAMFGHTYDHTLVKTEYFAGSLLFAMGMQNALVSVVSGSVVRTTHLTGMFTDLGIDLSAAVLSNAPVNGALKNRIWLRLTIIIFFLLGGIAGGVIFMRISFYAFFIPASVLFIALFFDYFRIKLQRAVHRKI